MTTEDKKCEDMVEDAFESRIGDLKQLLKMWYKDPERYDDELGRLDDYGLCFDFVAPGTFRDQRAGYWRYQLSCGGPQEEFRFYENGDIEFWYLHWFDGASVDVTDHETVQEIKDSYFGEEMFEWAKQKALED